MKHGRKILLVLTVCALVAAGGAAFAAGGSDDPLVSVGYLNKVFAPAVYQKVDEAVKNNQAALKADLDKAIAAWDKKLQEGGSKPSDPSAPPAQGSDSASFQVVTLSQGQTLMGQVGCEVMLRIGSAACAASSAPGLIDTTTGGVLNNGEGLQTNHLYMVTISPRGITATADVVKVLARGSYTVE